MCQIICMHVDSILKLIRDKKSPMLSVESVFDVIVLTYCQHCDMQFLYAAAFIC